MWESLHALSVFFFSSWPNPDGEMFRLVWSRREWSRDYKSYDSQTYHISLWNGQILGMHVFFFFDTYSAREKYFILYFLLKVGFSIITGFNIKSCIGCDFPVRSDSTIILSACLSVEFMLSLTLCGQVNGNLQKPSQTPGWISVSVVGVVLLLAAAVRLRSYISAVFFPHFKCQKMKWSNKVVNNIHICIYYFLYVVYLTPAIDTVQPSGLV